MLKLVIQGMDSVDTLKIVTDVQYEMSKLKIVNNKGWIVLIHLKL